MKKAKRLLFAVLIVTLVGISWMIALTQSEDDGASQEELVKKAKAYLDDEVYVLAVPCLEEALKFDTDRNEKIETTLKDTLKHLFNQYEYESKYEKLLKEEMAREGVTEEIFVEASDYYFSSKDLKKALAVLRDGIEKTGSEKLKGIYESKRYAYSSGYKVFDEVSYTYNNAIKVKQRGYWGLANAGGTLILPCQYEEMSDWMGDRVVIRDESIISAIDSHGNRLALLHEDASSFQYTGSNGAILQLEDGWHMSSKDFSVILPKAYEELRMISDERCAAAKENGKWGLVSTGGEWLISPEHDDIISNELGISYSHKSVFVKDDNKVVLWLNQDDKLSATENVFEDAKPFEDAYAAVKKDGKWGFINSAGKVVIDYQFEDARSFGQHLAAVKKDGKWGYVSLLGEIVIPCQFEDARSFQNGSAAVKMEQGWKFITLEERL